MSGKARQAVGQAFRGIWAAAALARSLSMGKRTRGERYQLALMTHGKLDLRLNR